jgi:hypothetical protein
MALSSRSRRSTEYCFMPDSVAGHHVFCKRL